MAIAFKEKAYDIIRGKILECEYKPNSYIYEKQLCDELNMSRTPVRDALSRLEQEGLVEIIPKKGVLIAPFNVNEINMIYETRLLLEPYTLANYGNRINGETLNKMIDVLSKYKTNVDIIAETNDINKIYSLDDEFHRTIIELSQNTYFVQLNSSIYAQNTRLRAISGSYSDIRLHETIHEHDIILNHIIKNDYKNASKALENHLLISKDASFNALFKKDVMIS